MNFVFIVVNIVFTSCELKVVNLVKVVNHRFLDAKSNVLWIDQRDRLKPFPMMIPISFSHVRVS